ARRPATVATLVPCTTLFRSRIALLALLGATAGQAVVWYGGQFYAMYFLQQILRVDSTTTWLMIAAALALATPFFVFFGWLSDKRSEEHTSALQSRENLVCRP